MNGSIISINKLIPNTLTLTRVILTFILAGTLYNSGTNLTALLLFFAVCATDLLDGRTARYLDGVTRFGSVFDIAADFMYILSSYAILINKGNLPVWLLILVIIKFTEFIVSSILISRKKLTPNSNLFFDTLGRISAVLYMLTPGAVILLGLAGAGLMWAFDTYLGIILVLSMGSLLYRLLYIMLN